jgi:hypothetical protein
MSIEEYKALWIQCEEEKMGPRQAMKQIAKTQRPATKFIREYMVENHLTDFDCGSGWAITCEEVEKVGFSEDICSPYMATDELARLKREQTKQRQTYKTIPPTKRQRTD